MKRRRVSYQPSARAASLGWRRVLLIAFALSIVVSLLAVSRPTIVHAAVGDISTFAGNGTQGYSGDGGPATSAKLGQPRDVTLDAAGNSYIADTSNNVVRKVDTSGRITTLAGNGTLGYSGDGGPATGAALNSPNAVAVSSSGDVYIGDYYDDRIRKVDATFGTITTVAGNGTYGYSGDGGPATSAQIGPVYAIVTLTGGGFMFADGNNNVIRKVDASGTITTIAGNGTRGYTGDSGPATAAELFFPIGLAADSAGGYFISDTDNSVIRKVDAAGTITTLPVTGGTLQFPYGLTFAGGFLFIADDGNDVIRKVDQSGTMTTVAGTGVSGYSGDSGPATSAQLNGPSGVATDGIGDLYIADSFNSVIRKVTGAVPDLLHVAGTGPLFAAAAQQFSYTFSVTDPGSVGAATGVTLSDALPSGTTFVSAAATQGSCNDVAGTVSCALGQLLAGASDTVTVAVTAPAAAADITNTATVSSNEKDPDLDDNSASVLTHVGRVDLAISETSPLPVQINQPFAYSITVAAGGAATGVTMKDTLPAGLQYVSAVASQGTCSDLSGTVTCALGAMADGSYAHISLTVTPTVAGWVTDTASVATDQPDINLANNSASSKTFVNAAACGEVITTNTKLNADVGPCYGDGVIIGADNITLDLNGHSILGSATRLDDRAGIRVPVRSFVTIENGSVSGFAEGVFFNSGGGNTVSTMNIHDNIGPDGLPDFGDGVFIQHSAANKILNSTITHNGVYDGIGIYGLDSNFNLVQGNTVSKNVSLQNGNDGVGVELNAFLDVGDPRRGDSEYGNNIIGNTIVDNQGSGISNVSSLNDQILSNDVERNGLDPNNQPDNGIGLQATTNSNYTTTDTVSNNRVIGNGWDGIETLYTDGNTITNNVTDGNNANGGYFNDLDDWSGLCPSTNTWTGNTYGTGGVYPDCLANTNTGGGAPPPPPSTKKGNPGHTASHQRHEVGATSHGGSAPGPVAEPAAPTGKPSATPACGSVITASVTLSADIGPCPGSGLIIGADNITVNLGGHTVTGGGAGDGTNAGIFIYGHQGVTVTNGAVTKFDAGVAVVLGANNTVQTLNVHDNVGPPPAFPFSPGSGVPETATLSDGIAVFHSFHTQVLSNTVTHNGVRSGIGVFGLESDATVIKNNTVTGTVGQQAAGVPGGTGIDVTALLEPNDSRRGLPINDNNVLSNTVTNNQGAGILSITNINATIQSNIVKNNGVGAGGSPRDGIQLNFDAAGGASPATTDSVLGNTVSGSGDDGIAVFSGGNLIKGNAATGDNVNGSGSFDLYDSHPTCDHNTWQGNTAGSAGVSPTCT